MSAFIQYNIPPERSSCFSCFGKWCLFFLFICGHLGPPEDSDSFSKSSKYRISEAPTTNRAAQYVWPSWTCSWLQRGVAWPWHWKLGQISPKIAKNIQKFRFKSTLLSTFIRLLSQKIVGKVPLGRKIVIQLGDFIQHWRSALASQIKRTEGRKTSISSENFSSWTQKPQTTDWQWTCYKAAQHACYKFDHTASFCQSPKLLKPVIVFHLSAPTSQILYHTGIRNHRTLMLWPSFLVVNLFLSAREMLIFFTGTSLNPAWRKASKCRLSTLYHLPPFHWQTWIIGMLTNTSISPSLSCHAVSDSFLPQLNSALQVSWVNRISKGSVHCWQVRCWIWHHVAKSSSNCVCF